PYFSLFTHPPPTPTYPLSLHDALPISSDSGSAAATVSENRIENRLQSTRQIKRNPWSALRARRVSRSAISGLVSLLKASVTVAGDRKSTRLNSSHVKISYAVFCLKKKT